MRKMTLLEEYGEDKEKNGISKEQERIVKNQLESGMDARTISETAKIPLSRVKEIESKLKE